jgi:hypothetical protein
MSKSIKIIIFLLMGGCGGSNTVMINGLISNDELTSSINALISCIGVLTYILN